MDSKRAACFAATLLSGMLALPGHAGAASEVHGHVYAADTSQPLAGATIQLFINCTVVIFETCDPEPSGVSASDGTYDLTGVEAGSGRIEASFDVGTTANYLRLSQALSIDDGTSTQLDLYMSPGAAIVGTVTSASDSGAVSNVRIRLLAASDFSLIDDTVTDSSGNFGFIRLDTGSFVVSTEDAAPYQDQYFAGHALTPPSQGAQAADTIALVAGQTANAINFSLISGGVIEGTITDSFTGLPIANASQILVDIYDANDSSGNSWLDLDREVATDADGHYAISGLPSVPIRLGIYSDTPYYNFTFVGCLSGTCDDVSDAAIFTPTTSPLTVDVALFPGSVATGTVLRRSDGMPLSGVVVEAYSNSLFLGHLTLATAATDAQGRYVLSNIPLATFFVDTLNVRVGGVSYIDQVYADHDCPQANCANVGDSISPATGVPQSGVDFALDVGGTISGSVLSGDTGLGIAASIDIYASDGSFSERFTTNADGTFETTGLQPGTYYLSAAASVPYAVCVIYPHGVCDSDPSMVGEPIVIEGTSSVSGIVIVFPANELFKGDFEQH